MTPASSSSLPTVIPVFPLGGALLLPRTRLPLNIFEPRYRAMVTDALKGAGFIGMVQPRSSGAAPPVYGVGCLGKIAHSSETEDGRYLIALAGISRFQVREELKQSTPYRQMAVDYSAFTDDLRESRTAIDRDQLLTALRRYLDHIGFAVDWETVEAMPSEALVNAIAMLAPFSPAEKQALLEAPSLGERAALEITLLRFAVADPNPSDTRPH
ncbi:MAG: LON peptidase substrate-binding domain-containing protein [Pseudomonadota bacterium]